MVCEYEPAGVPPGTPRPKYIGLFVVGLVCVGAAMVMPVMANVFVNALPVYVGRLEEYQRVLLTPNVIWVFDVRAQCVPATSKLAATLPFGSESVTSMFVGTFADAYTLPKFIELGANEM